MYVYVHVHVHLHIHVHEYVLSAVSAADLFFAEADNSPQHNSVAGQDNGETPPPYSPDPPAIRVETSFDEEDYPTEVYY